MHTVRRNVPGVVYHIVWRFVEQRFFIKGWRERSAYLHFLGRALRHTDWRCFGYAVMSNHIHLAMLAGRDSMAAWTRRVNSPFAAQINARAARIGPVFAQDGKDYAVASSNEARLLAYIHRNPVRAGLVKRAMDSSWTSHRIFAGRATRPPWLHVDEALQRIGMTSSELDRWVDRDDGDSGVFDTELLSAHLRKRGALRVASPSRSGVPVIARTTGYWRPDPRLIVQLGCAAAEMPPRQVCSRRRVDDAISTRRAIVFAAIAHGLTFSEIADSLGLSRQAIAKISRRRLTAGEQRLADDIRDRAEIEGGASCNAAHLVRFLDGDFVGTLRA